MRRLYLLNAHTYGVSARDKVQVLYKEIKKSRSRAIWLCSIVPCWSGLSHTWFVAVVVSPLCCHRCCRDGELRSSSYWAAPFLLLVFGSSSMLLIYPPCPRLPRLVSICCHCFRFAAVGSPIVLPSVVVSSSSRLLVLCRLVVFACAMRPISGHYCFCAFFGAASSILYLSPFILWFTVYTRTLYFSYLSVCLLKSSGTTGNLIFYLISLM